MTNSTPSNTCKDCGLEFITLQELQDHLALHQYDSIHTDKQRSLQYQIKMRAGQIMEKWLENEWCNR